MSNKSRLQTNNENLQALINKANSLPDAGGGGSVETCTVTLSWEYTSPISVSYVHSSGPVYESLLNAGSTRSMALTVVKNTIVTFFSTNNIPSYTNTGGVSMLGYESNLYYKSFAIKVVDSGTITIRDDD